MTRRHFLRAGTAAAAAPAILRAAARPNILFALADDWGWPHAPVYGDKVIRTPTFDRLCSEGVVFTQAFCAAPSCTPSRAAMLTGQAPHRLEQGGNLWSFLPAKYPVYTDLLENAGYTVGFERKGWGPGTLEGSGRTRNPAGNPYRNFREFFDGAPKDKPFCYWFGSQDPHRPYEPGSGLASGMDPKGVRVPEFLPDSPVTRSDFLDYYWEAQRFDREVGEMLQLLERAGRLDNTIVIMTGDNGCPFPRSKANIYNSGTHQPFALRWKAGAKGGRTVHEFLTLADMAPTFLEAAGLKPTPEMTGRSILGLATGASREKRESVFVERERHANCRAANIGYPMRGVRTREFLYIRNFRPDRWPAGDPERFGDVDPGPTKDLILEKRKDPGMAKFFELAFEKRPAEELYDLKKDPGEVRNVAGDAAYSSARKNMRARLDGWMRQTADPRSTSDADPWDTYPYVGGQGQQKKKKK